MGGTRLEKDRNRFSYSERLIVELFLLSYIFVFFLGETNSGMSYIWLFISVIGGIASYFLFNKRGYSLGVGAGLSLCLTVPLLLFGVPLMNVVIFFAFTLWRIQGNFNGSRINGWPFFIINTFVFVALTALARLLFAYHNPGLLVEKQMIIYLLTSFLYFFIRMITIAINSRQLGNFKMKDANKVFSYIIGLGAIVFTIVLFMLKPIRLGIFMMFGYVLNGIFTIFGKATNPILDNFREEAERIELEEEEDFFVDFSMEDKVEIYGASASPFEYAAYILAFLVLITIIVLLIIKRRENRHVEKPDTYSFFFKGKKAKEASKHMTYDYSKARDEVRKAFEQFEIEAQSYNFSRLQSETVSEWFSRMGWKQHNLVFAIYNNVRYGAHIPTKDEQSNFNLELDELKKRFFIKKD